MTSPYYILITLQMCYTATCTTVMCCKWEDKVLACVYPTINSSTVLHSAAAWLQEFPHIAYHKVWLQNFSLLLSPFQSKPQKALFFFLMLWKCESNHSFETNHFSFKKDLGFYVQKMNSWEIGLIASINFVLSTWRNFLARRLKTYSKQFKNWLGMKSGLK